MKFRSFAFLSLILLFNLFAQDHKANHSKSKLSGTAIDETQVQAKAVMGNVYGSFVKIIPYVYADKTVFEKLKNKKNAAELIANLTDISNSFKGAKHIEFFQRPGFRPSLETINSHLDETILSLQSHNFIFVQERLKALTALCSSCHSQLPETVAQNAFGGAIGKESRSHFESDFAYANYLFIMRKFTEAVHYFELTMKSRVGKSLDNEFYVSIRRVLSIYTKMNFNPDSAIAFLKQYQMEKNLNKMARTSINEWVDALEKWKNYDPSKMGSIHDFIEKYLVPLESSGAKIKSGSKDITLLIASGVLSKYLTEHPKTDETPEILYWLAVAERRLSSTYFFSLNDLYLKDCIILYPKSSYAKKCYQEYEDNITFGYSGSGGTDIPQEEKRELERLKRVLK
jgi:hypothetical protein